MGHTVDTRLLQILGFFSPAVLAAYREQPDKYVLTTDHFEGRVTVTSAYFAQLDEAAQDSEYIDVKFGYRTLKNGDLAIAVYLPDLVDHSSSHVDRWRPFIVASAEYRRLRSHTEGHLARVAEESERVLRGCLQIGTLTFSYGDPWGLWRAMLRYAAARRGCRPCERCRLSAGCPFLSAHRFSRSRRVLTVLRLTAIGNSTRFPPMRCGTSNVRSSVPVEVSAPVFQLSC